MQGIWFLVRALLPCTGPLLAVSPCGGERECEVSGISSDKDTCPLGSGLLTLVTIFNLCHLPKGPVSKHSHLGS